MANKNKVRHSRKESLKVPEGPVGGASSPTAVYARSPWAKFVSFIGRRLLLSFALSFITVAVTVAWIFYGRWGGIVLLSLALTLGLIFWLVSVSLVRKKEESEAQESGDETRHINDTHDRRGYPAKPQEDLDPLIIRPPREVIDNENVPWVKLRNMEDGFKALAKQVKDFDKRLSDLEQELYYPAGQKPREDERPRSQAAVHNLPKSPAIFSDSHQKSLTHSSSVDLQTLERAVCRFLEEERGNCEIDHLLSTVQIWTGSDVSVAAQHLVPYSSGEWRLVALWPQRSQEGLVLVSAGELVDDDIVRYFEVSFGRRIIACKQPARVSRSGSEVTVLQKGRVESS